MAPRKTFDPTQFAQHPLRAVLDSFLLDAQARNLTPKTQAFYRNELEQFLAFAHVLATDLNGVTPDIIRQYLVYLQTRRKGSSQHAAARALRAWLNWCVQQDLLKVSPCARVKMPKQERPLLPAFDLADVHDLLEAANTARDRAILLCLLDSGCRAAEFVALNIGDVDLKSGAVHVRHGKGHKERTVFFGPRARRELHRYLVSRSRYAATDALWLSEHDQQRLTVSGLGQLLRRLGLAAHVPHCAPHAFRRTCALWCHRAGWRVTEIQQLLGHSDLTTLRRYLDLDAADVQAAHQAHPPSALLG